MRAESVPEAHALGAEGRRRRAASSRAASPERVEVPNRPSGHRRVVISARLACTTSQPPPGARRVGSYARWVGDRAPTWPRPRALRPARSPSQPDRGQRLIRGARGADVGAIQRHRRRHEPGVTSSLERRRSPRTVAPQSGDRYVGQERPALWRIPAAARQPLRHARLQRPQRPRHVDQRAGRRSAGDATAATPACRARGPHAAQARPSRARRPRSPQSPPPAGRRESTSSRAATPTRAPAQSPARPPLHALRPTPTGRAPCGRPRAAAARRTAARPPPPPGTCPPTTCPTPPDRTPARSPSRAARRPRRRAAAGAAGASPPSPSGRGCRRGCPASAARG